MIPLEEAESPMRRQSLEAFVIYHNFYNFMFYRNYARDAPEYEAKMEVMDLVHDLEETHLNIIHENHENQMSQ